MTTTRDWPAIAYTLLWPGLGHLHQGRTTRGILLALWGLAAAIGWHLAPALGVSKGLFVAEMLLIAVITFADVARRPIR
jgi:hypothetical protein